MKLTTLLASGVCLLALAALPASGSLITVHVFNNDYSINPKGQPIVDPLVNVGDTVRWVWDEGFHDVVSVADLSESFASDLASAPYTFEHTFTQLGEFPYYCSLHGFDNGQGGAGGMAGIITVVPEPSSAIMAAGALTFLAVRRWR